MIKRRKYLVDGPFQLRLYLEFLFIITLSVVISGLLVSTYSYFFKTGRYVLLGAGDSATVVRLTDIIVPVLIFTEIVTALIALVLALFYSHRMAGPIYRFKKTAQEIANGNLDIKVKLRKTDEFKDLAEEMNKMIEGLKTRFPQKT